MPATNDFDTGSILGNLWSDIKHIPERTLQQSRMARAGLREQAVQQQMQQDAIQKQLDNGALGAWQKAYGDTPPPTGPDGRPNRAVINKMVADYSDQHEITQEGRVAGAQSLQRRKAAMQERGDAVGVTDDAPDASPAPAPDPAGGLSSVAPTGAGGTGVLGLGGAIHPIAKALGIDPSVLPKLAPVIAKVMPAIQAAMGGAQPQTPATMPQAIPGPDDSAPPQPGQSAPPAPFKQPVPPVVPDPAAPFTTPGADQPPAQKLGYAQRVVIAEQKAKRDAAMADFTQRKDIAANSALAEGQQKLKSGQIEKWGTTFGAPPSPDDVDAGGDLTEAARKKLADGSAKVAQGYRALPNGDWEPIPGSKPYEAQVALNEKKAKQDEADKSKYAAGLRAQNNLQANIQQSLDNLAGGTDIPGIGNTRAGVLGSTLRRIPIAAVGQGSENLHTSLDAIMSGEGINWLQDMKNASPTGTTGIGRIMQVEFEAASKAQRNISQTQDPVQLKANLLSLQKTAARMQRLYEGAMKGEKGIPQWYSDELASESAQSRGAGQSVDDLVAKYTGK